MLPTQGTLPSVQEPEQISISSSPDTSHVAKCPIMTPQSNTITQQSAFDSTQPRSCPVVHTTPEMKQKQQITQQTPPHLLPATERLRKALCSAGFASIVTTMITGAIWQPMMTTLVRQQFIAAQRNNIELHVTPRQEQIAPLAQTQQKVSSNVLSVIRNISSEGKRVFFRGLTPRLMQSPLACVQWTTYEMFRDTLANKDEGWGNRIKYALVFILSRALTTAAKCPFEVVKERMQVQGTLANFTALSPTSTTFQHFRHLIKTDGFGGLFRALPINICRDIPIAVLMMVGNDFWTHLLLNRSPSGFVDRYFSDDKAKRQKGQKTPGHISFLAGAMSGLVATIVTQPIDVAKTAIQTQSLATATKFQTDTNLPRPHQYTGLFDVLGTLRRQQGIKSWFVGVPLRATHLVLGGAVYLPLYRAVQQQLKFGFDVVPKPVSTQ